VIVPLMVIGDEHRIEQVVVNFVNNAIKYAPDSPTIHLDVSQSK
jgi:signal transduction histidine kinase